jgi:isopentenyl diphosphate isomerase/L-lactate dehydrogenase-like FMN-dependent dehydrogenase
MPRLSGLRTVDAVRGAAARRLPRGLFEYVDRGTEQEIALSRDRPAYDRIALVPRVLVDVSERSTAQTILAREQAMPLAIAPTGSAGLVWHRGEVALARAAAAKGVPFVLATRSMASIETIAAEAGGTLWLQLYASADRAFSRGLLERAAAAGFEALVVTVDTPTTPRRDYNEVNGFSIPFRPTVRGISDMLRHPRWLYGVIGRSLREGGLPRLENMPGRPRITEGAPASRMLDGKLTWDDLRALREAWPRAFVVKGILRPDDAVRAVDLGADAIVVSNHGGRNLDSAATPIEVLPAIVAAVGSRASVLVDGGIRRGSDIAKALALGAKAVLVGRATLYGTAVAGQAGAEHVLSILERELLYTMAMLGCPRIADLDSTILHEPGAVTAPPAERPLRSPPAGLRAKAR